MIEVYNRLIQRNVLQTLPTSFKHITLNMNLKNMKQLLNIQKDAMFSLERMIIRVISTCTHLAQPNLGPEQFAKSKEVCNQRLFDMGCENK